ncbi:MAG: hypothetical protein ACYCPN_04205 [Thermoplasmata archaeon]
MSHLFQRPLCEMGIAYDYAYREALGPPTPDLGGGCDDRPRRLELWEVHAPTAEPGASWRPFQVGPEHIAQLAAVDRNLVARGPTSRFRSPRP